MAAAGATTPSPGALRIEVLSNRADVISGGDALVAVNLPAGTQPSQVRVALGEKDVTAAFAKRANGRYEGLVTGMRVGENLLTARAPGRSTARAVIRNHPIGGPVFSGPQVQPWACQNGFVRPKCEAPTTYEYQYKSSLDGQLHDYDPDHPPADVATTTTQTGATVPFIIRIETGYQDRDQYKIALL